jgi:hypothetical protein
VVVAQDLANPCHKSQAIIQINVIDLNDNYPTFQKKEYTAGIRQDAQKGALVIKVFAKLIHFLLYVKTISL